METLRPGERLVLLLKGVSFENRQEAVAALRPGQPLLLLREPENPSDPCAVLAATLSGAQLGYLPRLPARHFQADATAAVVGEAGRNAAGVHWATVSAVPSRPGLQAELYGPPSPHLFKELPKAAWNALKERAYAATNKLCAVCGGAGSRPRVKAREVWRHDTGARCCSLLGFAALCPACHLAQHAKGAGTSDLPAVVMQLCAVNGWSAEESAAYLAWVARERARRAALGSWRLDLSWLRGALAETEVAADSQEVASRLEATWGGGQSQAEPK